MPAQIISQKRIATGNTVYGQIVTVDENEYDREIPGVGRSSFSVSVTGTQDHAAHTAGFSSLKDVKRYLHSGSVEEFTVYGPDGQEMTERRTGLGIPTGMIGQFDDGEVVAVPAEDRVLNIAVDTNVGDRQTTAQVNNVPVVTSNDTDATKNVPQNEPKSGSKKPNESSANKNG